MGKLPKFETYSSSINERVGEFVSDSYAEMVHNAEQAPKGRLDTYGATPLDHQLAFEQQCELLDSMKPLVEADIPDGTPDKIAEYVKDTFEARFHKRGTANFENFITALNTDIPEELKPAIEKARMGHASPAEILLVRDAMGIRSAELACLTHPYGKRIEHLDEMRDAVRYSVELMGGIYDDKPTSRFRVKGTVGAVYDDISQISDGFFMTRKRTVGVMPDGTIIRERTSFVLRTEYDGIPFVDLSEASKLDPRTETWQEDVVRAANLDSIASELMEANEYGLAIPISTTIYAFNEKTAEEVASRRAEERAVRCAESSEDIRARFPALQAALDEGRAKRAANEMAPAGAINVGDMLYIGPSSTQDN